MIGKRYEHGQKRTARILTSVAVACVLVIMTVIPSSAATARATTMKLEKTEGTATLKTQNGTARKISNGMHLYSGNTLATAASSYAYVSLDGSKAVKLDEKTTTTLRQSGKQLELLAKSGKLFFNVSSPLTEKESMNVRTSSMVAGIRGTCGVVEYVNPNKSKLYLIQGQVTLGYGENATTIYGGQTATVILREKEEAGESGGSDGNGTPGDSGSTTGDVEQKVYVDKLTEANVPIFAITEILSDPVLQQKIEATTDLKIEKIKEVYEESQNPEGTEEKKEEEKKPEETTSSGGSSGGSYDGGDSTGDVAQPTTTTLSGDSVTADDINTAFDTFDTVTLGDPGNDATETKVLLEKNIEVSEGETLIVNNNVVVESAGDFGITINGGTVITSSSDMVLSGLDYSQKLCMIYDVCVYGSVFNNEAASYLHSGSADEVVFHNNGTIGCSLTLETGDKMFVLEDAQISIGSGVILTNDGTISNEGSLINNGTLTNNGALISNRALQNVQASLLATANGTTYCYATSLNSNVASYMNEKTGNTWNFQDDAIVSDTITLTNFSADMGAHTLEVQGALTLSGTTSITGSGEKTIYLNGGTVTLNGKATSSYNLIENMSETGYAIARGDSGSLIWNDTSMVIKASASEKNNDVKYVIQDARLQEGSTEDVESESLDWVSGVAHENGMQFANGQISLALQ